MEGCPVTEPPTDGSTGSHPHSDRPNWQPAETIEDYIQNCNDGLETYSERRAAKFMGISRAALWRMKQICNIPEALFERLIEADPPPSARQLANIGRALKGQPSGEAEHCPHCGGLLRIRSGFSDELAKIADDWLHDSDPDSRRR